MLAHRAQIAVTIFAAWGLVESIICVIGSSLALISTES